MTHASVAQHSNEQQEQPRSGHRHEPGCIGHCWSAAAMPSRRVELALAHVAALGTTGLLISLAPMALIWCGAAVRNAGAFGSSARDCPWRWSSEVFFGVASLLPLASVLSALAAFTFRTEQDRVAKALALQGKVGEAPMSVSSCVSGLLAKVTAVLAPVTWLGLLFMFGGQWAGSSVLVGLLVEPLILVGCAAILALLCGAVRTVCLLCGKYFPSPMSTRAVARYYGNMHDVSTAGGLCMFFLNSLIYGVIYFYLSWFAVEGPLSDSGESKMTLQSHKLKTQPVKVVEQQVHRHIA